MHCLILPLMGGPSSNLAALRWILVRDIILLVLVNTSVTLLQIWKGEGISPEGGPLCEASVVL